MTHTTETKRPRRANGEGSVYPTAEGRWRGAITVTDATGRTYRRTASGPTSAAVKRRLKKVREDAEHGLTTTTMVLEDYLAGWLVRQRQQVRPATWREKERHSRLYWAVIGKIPISKLTPADVERVTSAMVTRGLSPATASAARITLRKALAEANRDGLVVRNAAALARPPRRPGRDMRPGRDYYEPEQVRALLAASHDHPLGPLIAVAVTTGLRQGEILGLGWSDVHDGTLTVRRSLARGWHGYELAEPKTPRSRRTIHLPALARDAMARERAAQEARHEVVGTAWQNVNDLVFTDSVGRPLSGTAVTHEFSAILRVAGLPHLAFHGLRHSAATALLAAGIPLKVVSDQLGHSTIAITADIYTGTVPALKDDAARAMDRILG